MYLSQGLLCKTPTNQHHPTRPRHPTSQCSPNLHLLAIWFKLIKVMTMISHQILLYQTKIIYQLWIISLHFRQKSMSVSQHVQRSSSYIVDWMASLGLSQLDGPTAIWQVAATAGMALHAYMVLLLKCTTNKEMSAWFLILDWLFSTKTSHSDLHGNNLVGSLPNVFDKFPQLANL